MDTLPIKLPESDTKGLMNFKETELTLGLPGESRTSDRENLNGEGKMNNLKRGFSETIDLKLGTDKDCRGDDEIQSEIQRSGKVPARKAQVVGWPPVRSFRKNITTKKTSCTYVKVGLDGAPYLRKVDLEMYASYQELLDAVEKMFTITRNQNKLMDPVNGTEYVPTYEDKDGDWMLVGDVPWKMFVESCRRIRLMKSSEAGCLAPRTPPKCT
ncbi:hypothetical protein C5167_035001 [Papaver somniferum]|uniref:Auxin-responsive protein n=1 Tax=Papaver somniferum TaxID=3469 RepID=A0A4Y7KGU5_PAPSO|nr:auxin-responsive protein IAA14-like [Papaver somniferum]RZC71612.1 hypothetical protein C5167_035001 [Papaver somniferum]